ncbi:MAG TPA: hypothetical protein ENI85_04980 [Deltaproteobacteria bacterium]|nr:hypothetical protein [Deltaproteobacteria bacterium]
MNIRFRSLSLGRRVGFATALEPPARRSLAFFVAGSVLLALASGCATYSERMLEVHAHVDRGDYESAIEDLNDLLGVDSADELPDSWKGDRPLAALERGVLLEAVEDFEASSRDLGAADEELEFLDLKTDAIGQIGRYIYSDSATTYRASPTERLALNGLNMANYLALGDLSGAAVESRRYTNMRDYLASIDLERTGTFGAYLSGFVFEHLGEGNRALRYYEEALEGGHLDSLVEPVGRLARLNPYRGPRIEALLGRAESEGVRLATSGSAPAVPEILAIFALGRVPHKVPERIPLGAAIGIAGHWLTGSAALLERSVFKVVVYPELVESPSLAREGRIEIDGNPIEVELVSHLGADIRREYELIRPRIIGAALSRMIARAAVAEGARAAGREAGGAGELVGLLAALATEGSLVALDRPDTRSWTFLPERIAVARTRVRPGRHRVGIRIPGVAESRSVPVDVPESGFVVLLITVPR